MLSNFSETWTEMVAKLCYAYLADKLLDSQLKTEVVKARTQVMGIR